METNYTEQYRGPHPGILALIFTVLFNAGLSCVISFNGPPYYPGPWESLATITSYFLHQRSDVLMCAFLQFGASIPLGIFTAAAVSRLKLSRVNKPGVNIALFGGFMTSFNLSLSALTLWVMSHPALSGNDNAIALLYYVTFAVGGVGYSVPMGLLIAGLAVTTGLSGMLPKWMMWFGIAIAAAGELSALSLVFSDLLFMIPLTRFPGFVWLILFGFKLPLKQMKSKIIPA
jgi:hypothetical protein